MRHTVFNKFCFLIKRLWTYDWIVYITIYTTIWFVPVIIPQTVCCFSVIFTVFKQILHSHYNIEVFCVVNLYSINFWNAVDKWSTVFKNQLFFTKRIIICSISSSCIICCIIGCIKIISSKCFFLSTIMFPFPKIYASLKSHKSDLSIDVLILISLFGL